MFVPRLVNEKNGVLGLGKGCHDLRNWLTTKRGALRYTLGSDLLTGYVVPLLWLRVDVKTTNVRLLHIGAHVRPLCVRRQVQVSREAASGTADLRLNHDSSQTAF